MEGKFGACALMWGGGGVELGVVIRAGLQEIAEAGNVPELS